MLSRRFALTRREFFSQGSRCAKLARYARVAKLADAPDLGFRTQRFQNVAFRFKKQRFYESKTSISARIRRFTNGE